MIYNVVIPNFDNVVLSYADTDSIVFETSSLPKDVYVSKPDIQNNFDLSVYKEGKVYNLNIYLYKEFFDGRLSNEIRLKNKGKLGTFKDEFPNTTIEEFICLRSKSYSILTCDDKIKLKKNKFENSNTKKTKGKLF